MLEEYARLAGIFKRMIGFKMLIREKARRED